MSISPDVFVKQMRNLRRFYLILRKGLFMTRNNILASVLYETAVGLKNQEFNKLIWKRNRDKLVVSLTAMQFLTSCLSMKSISLSQAEIIISILNDTYNFDTNEFGDSLKEACDDANYSVEYEELLFQMQLILSECVNCVIQKREGYINAVSQYIKAFHNLPRAFLSITDRSKISPNDAIEYSKLYLKID